MKNRNNTDRVFVNRDIRSKQVQCIDQNNKNLGVISTYEAIKLAQSAGLDLVMVSPIDRNQIPICKILDSGKYKYEMSKKKKDLARKKREALIKVKEIKFRPTTDVNDLKTKAKHAEKFLSEGCRIKVIINFKGREMSHKDIAQDRMNEFISLIDNVEVFDQPKMMGRQMTCTLASKKDNTNKELSKAV